MRSIWFLCGGVSLGIGIIGIFLPLLPTVPLLLLAAFCFGKSSPKVHHWLITHKTFGPPIEDWQRSGAIRMPAKRAATIAIVLAFSLSVWMQLPWHLLAIQAAVLSCVMIFIWTRPSG